MRVASEAVRVTSSAGSICWQVGNFVDQGSIQPLDYIVYDVFANQLGLTLRNRIVWTFGHGTHAKRRFSGRHETVLWFTKTNDYFFDLDAVRVPQKYPGKRHYKGPQRGQYSGNPLGKNPGDVWDIPNVKAKHVEKTEHPCQFPLALAKRLITSLTPKGGLVVDPYMGSGTAGAAAITLGRRFIGSDLEEKYVDIARDRLSKAVQNKLPERPDIPVRTPVPTEAVTKRPRHFKEGQGNG
ncbi:hypothetical protein GCM10010923_08270 [Blastomonas marina]|uniref:Methyltransferase n=2 Tax=Blastomonas marina TaxID=1867408 RepID=A0ABQ1F7I5_9SPHN|nr:hypothetical protein GCM10010923_08270 [Blastomonas marina]